MFVIGGNATIDAGINVSSIQINSGYTGTIRRLDPALTRDIVVLTPTADDPVVQAFVKELTRRGLPVPKPIAAKLTG